MQDFGCAPISSLSERHKNIRVIYGMPSGIPDAAMYLRLLKTYVKCIN